MGDEKKEIGEGAGRSDHAASGGPGAGGRQEAEVTRREFMRRAATVSGLAGFSLLGADALLDIVVRRMESLKETRAVAAFVAREAGDLGLLSRAHAEIDATTCSPCSTYCSSSDPHHCDDHKTGSDFNCAGFACDASFDNYDYCPVGTHDCGQADHSCAQGGDHGCGAYERLDFNCSSRYQCKTDFQCGTTAGSIYNFSCAEAGYFNCLSSFTCQAYFSCVDDGEHHGCPDAGGHFTCPSSSSFHCDTGGAYLCNPPADFDGVLLC